MSGSRCKELRRQVMLAGLPVLTKVGWRKIKRAWARDKRVDVAALAHELALSDARRLVARFGPNFAEVLKK